MAFITIYIKLVLIRNFSIVCRKLQIGSTYHKRYKPCLEQLIIYCVCICIIMKSIIYIEQFKYFINEWYITMSVKPILLH